MQTVGAVGDRLGNGKWHPHQKQKKKKEGGKIPVLSAVGSTANIFPLHPFRDLGDANIEGFPFPMLPAVWCGGGAPWLVSVRSFTCRIK